MPVPRTPSRTMAAPRRGVSVDALPDRRHHRNGSPRTDAITSSPVAFTRGEISLSVPLGVGDGDGVASPGDDRRRLPHERRPAQVPRRPARRPHPTPTKPSTSPTDWLRRGPLSQEGGHQQGREQGRGRVEHRRQGGRDVLLAPRQEGEGDGAAEQRDHGEVTPDLPSPGQPETLHPQDDQEDGHAQGDPAEGHRRRRHPPDRHLDEEERPAPRCPPGGRGGASPRW